MFYKLPAAKATEFWNAKLAFAIHKISHLSQKGYNFEKLWPHENKGN